MAEFYAYIYYRKDGVTPFYVGKGKGHRYLQFSAHNKWCQRIIHKEGRDNIKVEVIPCQTEKEAFDWECLLITQLRMFFVLCNFTEGGEGCAGRKLSKETRSKIAESHKGIIPSEQTKSRISITLKGIPLSKERKEKMAISRIGRYCSAQTREKLSHSLRGNKNTLGHLKSEEHRKNLSIALKGNRNASTSIEHPRSEEHCQRLSESLKKYNASTSPRIRSEETRNKISASLKKYHQNKMS